MRMSWTIVLLLSVMWLNILFALWWFACAPAQLSAPTKQDMSDYRERIAK